MALWPVKVRWAGQSFSYTLPAGAAATLTWTTGSGGDTGISPTAWYDVINTNSNKCVDDAGWGTTNGAALQQWACGSAQYNQEWQFTPTSSSYYKVVPRYAPALGWDVTGLSTADGALMQLRTHGGGNNQQWLPQSLGNGVYRFVARHSAKCLDVPGSSTADGARLDQWSCNNTAAQSFRLAQQP
jgi:glucosylceramidase